MSIESVMPSNHLILCRSLLLLLSIFLSIGVFSNESVLCIRWPKYWNLSFSISPSNEYSKLSSFRMDWLDPLAVQGTLESLLQHHSQFKSISSSALRKPETEFCLPQNLYVEIVISSPPHFDLFEGFCLFLKYLFICLCLVLGEAHRIFDLLCSTWDL